MRQSPLVTLQRRIKQALPPGLKHRLRYAGETVIGWANPGVPPPPIRRTISPTWLDFRRSGRDQVEFLVELAGLQKSDRVLDVACGCGRVALPLTRYLTGKYEGFDTNRVSIDWCRGHIQARYPNFRFTQVDVQINSANPRDTAPPAAEFRFPYVDKAFDVVFAGSIFTHLLPGGAEDYLAEAARVLDGGGRLVATWLLYNPAGQQLAAGRSLEAIWPHDRGNHRVADEVWPEKSVLYQEGRVRDWYAQAGLAIAEPVRVDASYNPAASLMTAARVCTCTTRTASSRCGSSVPNPFSRRRSEPSCWVRTCG